MVNLIFISTWFLSGFLFWSIVMILDKKRNKDFKVFGNEYAEALLIYSLAFGYLVCIYGIAVVILENYKKIKVKEK